MKYLIKHWTKENDGILYFFQRLEEMLFHYSTDIVRVPVHNTKTLLLEYINTLTEKNKGQVREYQLNQIQDELLESIKENKILYKVFGEEFIADIVDSIPKDKDDAINYFSHKITKSYYKWCLEYIKEHAIQATHKDEIEFGLRSWIVEVISYGHSPEYIYSFLHTILEENPNLEPQVILFRFLDRFSLIKQKYRVYLSFNSKFLDYRDLFSKRLNIVFDDDPNSNIFRIQKKDFVGYLDVESLDCYTAVSTAFDSVAVFIKYYQAISNSRKDIVRKFGFVKDDINDKFIKIPVKPFGFHSIELDTKNNFKETVDRVIMECQNKINDTSIQLNRMISLHNAAINQNDLNSGFLNLWSILEIITSNITCESKIDKVITGIIPVLQKDYLPSLIENIHIDLVDNLSNLDYLDLINQLTLEGETKTAIARFIFSPKYEELRESYFVKLAKYPVIRNKIYKLYLLKNDKSQLLKLSTHYTKRVRWHIYRLYRTRNSIVHSGKSHSRIQILVEHLHIYVDQILFELLAKLTSERTLKTIPDVLIDAKLMSNKINKSFGEKLAVSDSDLSILFDEFYYKTIE